MADQEIQRIAVERERAALKKRIEEREENEGKDKSETEDDEKDISHLSNPFQPIQVLVVSILNNNLLTSVINFTVILIFIFILFCKLQISPNSKHFS